MTTAPPAMPINVANRGIVTQDNPDLLKPTSTVAAHVSPLEAKTAPFPVETVEPRYYVCTVPAASFMRADGKKIPFVFGFCVTDQKKDIEYLENEIAEKNPYVRRATEDEIHAANMRRDPRGTIRAEVEADVEAKLRAKIMEELRANGQLVQTANADGAKLAGVDSAVKSGGVQVAPVAAPSIVPATPTPVVARLQGIANSATIGQAAAGSVSQVAKV